MTALTIAPAKAKLYYGWIMVSTLAVTETISWGILYYAFSIFMLPMQHDYGWSRGAMTGAFSLGLLMNGLAGIGIGRLLDKHGARWLMTLGSTVATCLVIGWSQVASLPALYLVWAGIGLTMAAVLYEPAFAVIATWFIQKRGRALTLLTFIGGLASVIFIPLSNYLIQTYDWQNALIILATILGMITIPLHSLILRRQPSDMGLLPDGAAPGEAYEKLRNSERHIQPRQAMRHSTFWWLTAAFMFSTLAGVALLIHLTPFLAGHGQLH